MSKNYNRGMILKGRKEILSLVNLNSRQKRLKLGAEIGGIKGLHCDMPALKDRRERIAVPEANL